MRLLEFATGRDMDTQWKRNEGAEKHWVILQLQRTK